MWRRKSYAPKKQRLGTVVAGAADSRSFLLEVGSRPFALSLVVGKADGRRFPSLGFQPPRRESALCHFEPSCNRAHAFKLKKKTKAELI